MALVNMAEKIVALKFEDMKDRLDCCTCQECYMDIMALALNSVKPMYVNTNKGEVLKKLDATIQQNSIDINIAIANAVETVKKHSRHEGIIK